VSTVSASNRLAALKGYVLIAVAAFVMYGAGVGVDDGCVLGAALGLSGVVGLGGHFVCRGGVE
jgi:hypothetical protein